MSLQTFKEVGYPNAKHYTNPDMKVDFAVYSNEDIGLDAALTINDTYAFALPYPSDVDIDDEAMIVQWIDFIYLNNELDWSSEAALNRFALGIVFSMLKIAFGNDSNNPISQLDSVNQSEFKKCFDGQYIWELTRGLHSDAIATGGMTENLGAVDGAGQTLLRWIPVHPIDLPLPLFIGLTNLSMLLITDRHDTTGTRPSIPQANMEFIALRVWYTKRNLTPSEKAIRGAAKFARLSS